VIGVLVSGEGTNLQALLDAALPIAGVIASKPGVRALDRARGAGVASAVFALDDFPSREERDGAMADWLEQRGVDLVVCAGFMYLLSRPFLARFPGRIVNTHAGRLPDFPGMHPVEDALSAGVAETAATVFYVDDGVDTGPVIASERVPVLADDTVESLRERVQAVEHRILPEVVEKLCAH
jgi:phosphoribosylglycinamide formyltransferase-1